MDRSNAAETAPPSGLPGSSLDAGDRLSIQQAQDAIIDELAVFGDWMGKYQYVIGQGDRLVSPNTCLREERFLLPNCQRQVWLKADCRNGRMDFQADSDARITLGLMALVLRVLDGQRPADIINADLRFISATGLDSHFSSARGDGLAAIVDAIRNAAERWAP